jgi:hypothetical protein
MPQTLLKPKINQENNTYTTPIGWVPAERIVSDFTHELEFEQLLETHGVNPNDRSSIQYAHALSDYVREYTDRPKATFANLHPC